MNCFWDRGSKMFHKNIFIPEKLSASATTVGGPERGTVGTRVSAKTLSTASRRPPCLTSEILIGNVCIFGILSVLECIMAFANISLLIYCPSSVTDYQLLEKTTFLSNK
uniref:Uncharacterized protein n=1 Tax=Glossina brevipalpis TaxID=37001 RepID=A0A1A9WXQ1_9MUSC